MFRQMTTVGVAAAALTATVAVPAASAAGHERPSPASYSRLRTTLNRLTSKDQAPGALAQVRDARGGATVITSGKGNRRTGAPIPRHSAFRVGSQTKTFAAAVMLQLVGEHKVALDAPVERYLPGVVRGPGGDGHAITVREVLQHTSGIPEYTNYIDIQSVLSHPHKHYDARALLRLALEHKRLFKPGTKWSYSSTNYILAGMIIERVTGHTFGDEVRRRVIRPLHLRHTFVPGDSSNIPGPHPRGYVSTGNSKNPKFVDITSFNPSLAGASGNMISTGGDLNRFYRALLHGHLLRPAQLRQMTTTRATSDRGTRYGLGLERVRLSCGGVYWGHDGGILGFGTLGGATRDGKAAEVMINVGPGTVKAQETDMAKAVDAALCHK